MSVLSEGRIYGQEPPEKDVATYTQMGAGAAQKQKVCSIEHCSDTSSELSPSLREKIIGKPGGGKSRNQNYGYGEGTRDGRGYSEQRGVIGEGARNGRGYSGQRGVTGEGARDGRGYPGEREQSNGEGARDGRRHLVWEQGNGEGATAGEGTSAGANTSGVGEGNGRGTAGNDLDNIEDREGYTSAGKSNSPSSRQYHEKQAQTSNIIYEAMGTTPDLSCRCEQWRGKCTCPNCDFSNCRYVELKQSEQATGGLGSGTRSSDSEQRKGKCQCCNCNRSECIYGRDSVASGTTASRNIEDFTETSTQTFTECCCTKQKTPRCLCQRHHRCNHCYRSSWSDHESSSDNSETDESCNMDFMELPYQNNDEYMELLRELESKLVARNRERVRKTRQEFETRSRQNENLDEPVCNYDESCGFDDDNVILEKLKGRSRNNKQHNRCTCCCNRNKSASRDKDSDIFQNERRWDTGQVNFVEAVVKSMDPNPNVAQKYPKFERSVRRSHWQMDPKSGEWVKVSAYQQMDYHCPRMCRNTEYQKMASPQCCRNGGHRRRHRKRQ